MGEWFRSRFTRGFSRGASSVAEDPRHLLGQAGERAATGYLKRNGFRVLYRNFRAHGGGEIDIVCREKNTATLVFVEVKTRSTLEWGNPSFAVNEEKQRLIIRGALEWLRMLDFPEIRTRFDIVEVVGAEGNFEFNLIRNAFNFPKNYHP